MAGKNLNNYSIRELEPAHLVSINKWRNDRELIDLLGNNFIYIAFGVDEKWYSEYLANRSSAIRFAIVDTVKDFVIGTVQLTAIHQINRSAEFSIMVGEKDYWNKGAGTAATELVLRHGFDDLNLNRIYLTVLTNNLRAIFLYRKFGFRQEGILRQSIYKQGHFNDQMLMSLLKEEYYRNYQGLPASVNRIHTYLRSPSLK